MMKKLCTMLQLHRSDALPRITMKGLFLISALAGITSTVSSLHSEERWHPSGFLVTSGLRTRRPVFSSEGKQMVSFNQAVNSDSFVYKKGTKDFSAECGIENMKAFSHVEIFGGQEAKPNQWPWQVAVEFDDIFICGGSLISDEWVMTAAHCAEDGSKFRVIAGAHNLTDEEPHCQEIISHEAIVHPDFSWPGYDIALIKLPEKFTFNEYIKPVCLPGRNEDASVGDNMTVTGWGDTENGPSDVLRMVELTIISNKECGGFNQDVLCASVEGHKGSCYGDSGGPLVKKSTGKWIQHGIVSFGTKEECGTGYDGYTRVHFLLDWIETTTGIMIH